MKAILISIKPKWIAKILNGEKTIEIRKSEGLYKAIQTLISMFGYVEFYAYCTKEEELFYNPLTEKWFTTKNRNIKKVHRLSNGVVKFKFRCYKVEEFRPFFHWCIEKETCLTRDEVLDYLDSKDKFVGNPKRQGKVYAIHISDLEIFNEPKELSEFSNCDKYPYTKYIGKAPQNFCYVEVEEDE